MFYFEYLAISLCCILQLGLKRHTSLLFLFELMIVAFDLVQQVIMIVFELNMLLFEKVHLKGCLEF